MSRRSLVSPLVLAAAALLAVAPSCRKPSPPSGDPLAGLSAEAAYEHTRAILEFGPRPPGSEALDQVRGYLATHLETHGWQTDRQVFNQSIQRFNPALGRNETVEMTFSNVVARFGGKDAESPWSRPVTGVLGAHLDSKDFPGYRFLGADDAASAVGAILELARQLQDFPELASQLELVFFDGEEAFGQNITPTDGLYGSRHYAANWRGADFKPDFGIVLDMIGHKDLKIRIPSDSPPPLERKLRAAARAEGASSRFTRGPTPIIDDHVPLNDAGIPTLDLIGDFSQFDWWHTEADDLSIISKESLAVSLKVTRRLLEALLRE